MGQLEDDKLHGKGKMEFGSGAKYIGDWVNGAMTGEGIYIFPNGTLDELSDQSRGRWDENKAHGIGRMDFINGDRYTGDWVYGARTGEGILSFANGNMEFGSGAEYTGDWVDGAMTGEGIYIFPNGNRYERRYSQLRYGCVLNYIGFNKFRGDEIRE
ncbi:unnamed protein product [Rotaria socialis]|uniref:MORN repeat protein n=1 Tax=Rotaria socialis TaxID=392032 RepID=A0A821IMW6_9BILA|nr:unnamed protein product [Rotaria socialis]CAF4704827.1 unnamed protein product [Rotaria socialis]